MDDRVAGALAALVAYILWRRNIVQNAWGALWGPSQRAAPGSANVDSVLQLIASGTASDQAQNLGTSVYPGTTPTGDEWEQSGCTRGNYSCLHAWQAANGGGTVAPTGGGAGGNAIVAAEGAGLASTVRQYGSDLWNWCLAWVNKTRQAAGLPIGPYGAATAAGACSQLQLHSGIAPAGATVCFAGNPGHIGIADGGDSYTSAGLIHGGLSKKSYLNNPAYLGFAL